MDDPRMTLVPNLSGSFLPNKLRETMFINYTQFPPVYKSKPETSSPNHIPSVGISVSNLDLIHRHWHQVYLNQTVVQSTSMRPSLTLRLSHQSTFPAQSQVDVIRLVPSRKQLALQVPHHTESSRQRAIPTLTWVLGNLKSHSFPRKLCFRNSLGRDWNPSSSELAPYDKQS